MLYSKATNPGSAHIVPGKPGKINNQDASLVFEHKDGLVCVVADGCGSKQYSEVGAHFGVHAIRRAVCKELEIKNSAKDIDWSTVTISVKKDLARICRFLSSLPGIAGYEKAVVDYALFTSIVLVTDATHYVIAAVGDGCVIVDNEKIVIEPPISNAPAYIGYNLLSSSGYHSKEMKEFLSFSVVKTGEIARITKSIIIGSDGLAPLMNDEELHQPDLLVGDKSLQRWLNVQTTEKLVNGKLIHGRCDDDATLILLRPEEVQADLMSGKKHKHSKVELVDMPISKPILGKAEAKTEEPGIETFAPKPVKAQPQAEELAEFQKPPFPPLGQATEEFGTGVDTPQPVHDHPQAQGSAEFRDPALHLEQEKPENEIDQPSIYRRRL